MVQRYQTAPIGIPERYDCCSETLLNSNHKSVLGWERGMFDPDNRSGQCLQTQNLHIPKPKSGETFLNIFKSRIVETGMKKQATG